MRNKHSIELVGRFEVSISY